MQAEYDKELQSYFTDVEHPREMFKQWLAAPTLPKRLLVIHGVGGVGKSSLLRMFRLHAKSVRVPVALASGDEQKSALDVLTRWADDLTADGVALPAFKKTLAQYRALYLKVEDETAKIAGKVTKEATKTLVETAASMIPGVGPLVGKLGGMGVEALTDWLFSRGFKKPDVDLLLDPAKKLTEDFLADVTSAAEKQRLVLMLDTFEQMEALNDWTRDVAQRVGQVSNLSYGVLLVIAGRIVPNWDRSWHGWMANAHIEELKPMTEENMRALIRRYYATMRGGEPDPKQVEAIIAFARGLPMVVTSAVQLWVKYSVEDFQAVKPEIVANLVDRLMEGVPKELTPALEAAAIVRWFDQPILRAVMKQEDVRDLYNELRRFPFVRTRTEGLALHDAVRDIIDENLRVQDAERHRELHERAAAYFEKRLEKATGEEAERLGLERLYHRIRADEEAGIKLFQEMAEELVRYRMVNRLRALLNDVNTYPLERENSRLWLKYYDARLMHNEGRWHDAEEAYKAISENGKAEDRLRAYALRYWGAPLRNKRQIERAIEVLNQSLSLAPLDSVLVSAYLELAVCYRRKGMLAKSIAAWQAAKDYYDYIDDKYGLVITLNSLKTNALWHGDLKEALRYKNVVQEVLLNMEPQPLSLKMQFLGDWAIFWAWFGRLSETEKDLREALDIADKLQFRDIVGLYRDLGYVLALQDRHLEASDCFTKAGSILARTGRDKYTADLAITIGFEGAALIKLGDLEGAERTLLRSLELKSNSLSVSGEKDQEVCLWLGQLYEIQAQRNRNNNPLNSALSFYNEAMTTRIVERRHYECNALTGLTRVKHAQGDYAAIPPLLAEAEQLAQQYEYNDHLASLRLTQGHIAWEGNAPSWENGFDAALHYYQHALIYALRYNRFLLDEVLSGRPQGTPLRPIIPECLKRGEEGRRMLIALRDWWQTGINDIGTPRPDTISPIPEGIPLLEAERIAREREPGDGSPQRSVVEQIEHAL